MTGNYPFRNLVFEGAGVKGVAYAGAFDIIDQEEIAQNIVRVGGASSGAIMSVIVGLGYSGKEVDAILRDIDFKKFMDGSWNILSDLKRMADDFGWFKGDYFRDWMGEKIKDRTGSADTTFSELEAMKDEKGFRDIYLIGTNLSTRFYTVFSHEDTGDVAIADAARISMSIPLFFQAVRDKRKDVYVDGGVLNLFPVKLFDREKYLVNPKAGIKKDYYDAENEVFLKDHPGSSPYVFNAETLGFKTASKAKIGVFRDGKEPPHHKIDNLLDYTSNLIQTIAETQDNIHMHTDDWHRTVFIDSLGVSPINFFISDEEVEKLVASGKKGTRYYLDGYQNPEIEYLNRVPE